MIVFAVSLALALAMVVLLAPLVYCMAQAIVATVREFSGDKG